MAKHQQSVSVKQIAETLGLSPSTVSMVLNNRSGEFRIAESTSQRVLNTAQELGYRSSETRVKRKKRGFGKTIVCTFCPHNFEKGPMSSFYEGFYRYMKSLGNHYETIIFPFELGLLKQKMSFISKDFMAGAIMMALTEEDLEFLENTKFDVPVVLYNRTAKGYCSVLTDDYAVGNSAMEHFIKRGHERFGIVSPNYSSRALSLRSTGYWDKLKSSGLESKGAIGVPVTFGDDDDAGGYLATKELLQSETLPTALFVPSDNMITGVLRCLKDHHLSVPGDMELISYGNKQVNSILTPSITSFLPPAQEMSYNSAKLLHSFIESGTSTDTARLSFEATCIFRESSPE